MTDFDDVPLHIGMTTDPGCSFPEPPFNAYQARAASDMRNDLLTAASLARDEHTARLRLLRLCAHPSFAAVALENDGRTIALPLAQSAARLWGNLRFGLRDRADPCEREAFAWDMETNVRAVRLFRTARMQGLLPGGFGSGRPGQEGGRGADRLRLLLFGRGNSGHAAGKVRRKKLTLFPDPVERRWKTKQIRRRRHRSANNTAGPL